MLQRRILKAVQRKIGGDFPILMIFFFEAESGVSLCGVGNCRIKIRNCCNTKLAYSTTFNILKTYSLSSIFRLIEDINVDSVQIFPNVPIVPNKT